MFPADKLPNVPFWRVFSHAYIVNTDPAGEPGEHWLAIWTRNRVCEVLHVQESTVTSWFKQWKEVITSDMTIQAMDSQTCGHYALMFLKAKAGGSSFPEFLAQWN